MSNAKTKKKIMVLNSGKNLDIIGSRRKYKLEALEYKLKQVKKFKLS
jgi:hypothetical protein